MLWTKQLFTAVLMFGAIEGTGRAQSFEWQTATPQSQGMSQAKLDALRESLAAHKTAALLVIRNDKIVCEWYAANHSATRPHYTASMAKAIVGGLSLGVALTDGRISLDDPAAKFIPQWSSDPRKSKITIRQLGSHTSGIEDAEADGLPHEQLTGWKGDFWKRLELPRDPFTISRDDAPVLFEPGEKLAYSNPGIGMLSYAVTAALQGAPQQDIRALLRDRIMRPIGVPDNEWSMGYGKTFTVDGLPLVGSWGGGNYTARAAARVGRLMLRGGDWEGQKLLTEDAVAQITSDAGTPGTCGIGWWSNNEGRYANVPRDAYWGRGAGHQILLVVPSLNLIAVRNGAALVALETDPSPPKEFDPLLKLLFEPLIDAIVAAPLSDAETAAPTSSPALPPRSPVIANLTWAPKDSIVRKAKGGDNWPMTWADDGHLYTAYGDGWGFEPLISEKLSMGLCRVEGGPDVFRGVNLRSPSLERKGEGMKGVKASGMLMVEGVLYVLVRNAENSQLGWSADHGQTWTWSDWRFTKSMGCPTFLNFGQNYAGARDEYVYLYSLDHDSAYEAADRMLLAQAPKSRIKDKAAYEFFQSRTAGGDAVWTKDFEKRGAVFDHPGKCYRSGVTYNAALQRYLWCQILPTSTHPQGPRFQGGFGIYDAPHPWGPWTTVYYTDAWDVGPGETSSFPTKWMSPDGKTLHLVFSGDDYFSVRQATLTLKSDQDETGFTPLFDGKSLAGWEGDPKIFRIEDGAIVAGSKTERIAHNEFLASKEEFGDFELRLEARLVGKGQNAGVQFRSQRVEGHFEMIGYQCDMGAMRGQSIWGALYDESRRRKFLVEPPQDALKSAVKSDDWNDLAVRCEGPRIQMWVNGVQTVDYTEADAAIPKTGRFGLQIHGGEPAEAAYRNIRIKRW